ncbi:DUF6036 family nucleotidyltransferase [Rhizobium leguminosarum]|uniref:DUF6036 family nucleotidyltransferase n=1 Tax=Rhizobium leguminosarum TaxID=384 RepID=UPI002E12BE0E|nr:DUF6036 family nucleotidyltransferase [Rhizobium leguminosarum]
MQPVKRIPVRTPKDLGPLADKLSTMFDTDVVVVVGSQALLVGWPSSPEGLRQSAEIDAYPANWRAWEDAMNRAATPGTLAPESSEEIAALCGDGSTFDRQWGFYIDGVNGTTAPLPKGWQERAVYKEGMNRHGTTVTVVAPSPEDTIVSKSLRLADKDRDFIELYHKFRPIDPVLMRQRLMAVEGQHPEIIERAARFFETLPTSDAKKQQDPWKAVQRYMPDYPSETHCAFYNAADNSVIIRKWDPALEIYNKVDNPLGPAVAGKNIEKYFVGGRAMDYDGWVAETSPTDEVGEDMELSEVPSWKLG